MRAGQQAETLTNSCVSPPNEPKTQDPGPGVVEVLQLTYALGRSSVRVAFKCTVFCRVNTRHMTPGISTGHKARPYARCQSPDQTSKLSVDHDVAFL